MSIIVSKGSELNLRRLAPYEKCIGKAYFFKTFTERLRKYKASSILQSLRPEFQIDYFYALLV